MAKLLGADEPAPFSLYNPVGKSPFFLSGDHAGNRVPALLSNLGLPPEELERHIAIDIGIEALGKRLADKLDAPFFFQPYSRLVIDCNRPPDQADAVPAVSDGTHIPGNADLDADARATRVEEIFDVYHAEFSTLFEAREKAGKRTVLVALHSFTPFHGDFPANRPWHIGVLWNRDGRLAAPLIENLSKDAELVVGDNQPYRVSDELDYAIPVHGEARNTLSVELEVRQDLISDDAGVDAWATRLARVLPIALSNLQGADQQSMVSS
ncbi:MAG: N-formylglutamate amidohydrolase [Pseudomonadota bacterium]